LHITFCLQFEGDTVRQHFYLSQLKLRYSSPHNSLHFTIGKGIDAVLVRFTAEKSIQATADNTEAMHIPIINLMIKLLLQDKPQPSQALQV
jgi:hypothetical protein